MRTKLLVLLALAIVLVPLLAAPVGAEDLYNKVFNCNDGFVKISCPGPVP